MATHIVQHQLLQAVVALLQAAPAVAELVQEERDDSAGFTAASVVNLSVPSSEPDEQALSGSPVMWASTLQAEVMVRAGDGITGRGALSPVVAALYARLMNDTTLAAAGWYVDGPPRLAMDSTEAQDRIGGARLTWRVLHRSAWADLTVAA